MRSLKRLPFTLVALYALLISPLFLEGADLPSARQPSELSLLDSTPGRLLLELSVPDFTLDQIKVGEEQFQISFGQPSNSFVIAHIFTLRQVQTL